MIQSVALEALVLWNSRPLQYVVLFPKKKIPIHHTK